MFKYESDDVKYILLFSFWKLAANACRINIWFFFFGYTYFLESISEPFTFLILYEVKILAIGFITFLSESIFAIGLSVYAQNLVTEYVKNCIGYILQILYESNKANLTDETACADPFELNNIHKNSE